MQEIDGRYNLENLLEMSLTLKGTKLSHTKYVLGFCSNYDRKVPILRGPNNSMNTGLKMTILGYLATMFTIGVNEMWHFWFVEEIFAVPNHWMFNMGVVVAFMGALAYVVRVYARLVELGAETPGENPYVAEMYKMALEGKLYSRSIP